ncbi:MAG: hypothetical protein V7739_05215 [Motiliproteus sp.]
MKSIIALLVLVLTSASANAATDAQLALMAELQGRWAEIKYSLEKEQKEKAFEQLSVKAEQLTTENADIPELLIWKGIIFSTYAGEKGGLGALGLLKTARSSLEHAIEVDPKALSGSAYTSLGALFYQVPGWPISFGSDKKARQNLELALKINPDGIDSNFFYGEFLVSENEIEKAREVLQHALAAAARPDRPLADKGRRQEIKQLLSKLDKKTNSKNSSY